MAIWDLRPKADLTTGVAVGVGLLAAPVVMPLMWSVMRPLVKAVLKGGFLLYATGLGMLGAGGETSDTEERKEAPEKAKSVRERAKPRSQKKPAAGRRTGAAKPKKSEAPAQANDRKIPATD